MTKKQQLNLFQQGEDLPLFTHREQMPAYQSNDLDQELADAELRWHHGDGPDYDGDPMSLSQAPRTPRDTSRYDWLSIEPNSRGGFTVYGHGTYEETSVLAGRAMRCYLESFDTAEQAAAQYPAAEYVAGSTRVDPDPGPIAPSWFDPAAAGERWDDDY